MRRSTFFLTAVILCCTVLTFSSAIAQDDDFIMLEEITIKVEPERPTVVVTIPREAPDIQVGELARPEESRYIDKPSSVRPRLADLEITEIEKPKKILAKDR
ncbi:hypothetical protein ACFLQV_02205 [Calditrichota bacterium]